MKRLSIGLVGYWSLVLIALSLIYFFKPSATLPAQFVYMIVGLLGIFIHMDLKSQKHRILQLEKRIDDLENSTNS
ncbi:MAG: hypothetical protein V3S16_07565 [Candidatus Desulfatibia sp.]|uniref:hypothetical protein n=1 Tax=Candidatus Desulfatibia sp. TaxID=3101189 RepID=UPI002F2E273B